MQIKKVDISLPASEYALYLELEHYLRAQDMVVKKVSKKKQSKKKQKEQEAKDEEEAKASGKNMTKAQRAKLDKDRRLNDREKRLNESLGESEYVPHCYPGTFY